MKFTTSEEKAVEDLLNYASLEVPADKPSAEIDDC